MKTNAKWLHSDSAMVLLKCMVFFFSFLTFFIIYFKMIQEAMRNWWDWERIVLEFFFFFGFLLFKSGSFFLRFYFSFHLILYLLSSDLIIFYIILAFFFSLFLNFEILHNVSLSKEDYHGQRLPHVFIPQEKRLQKKFISFLKFQ